MKEYTKTTYVKLQREYSWVGNIQRIISQWHKQTYFEIIESLS